MTELFSGFNFDLNSIYKMTNINKKTQNHLATVYATLATGVLGSLFSGYLASKGFIGEILIGLLTFAIIVTEIVSMFMKLTGNNKFIRSYLNPGTFYGYSIVFGGSIGILFNLDFLSTNDKLFLGQLVMSSFIYTVSIFTIFSIFALMTVRRKTIFFGSLISCLVLSIVSIFVFNLYIQSLLGLVIGILYVVIDTQMIIARSELGIFDVYADAKQLLIDLFKIFIEILKILLKEKDDKKKKK